MSQVRDVLTNTFGFLLEGGDDDEIEALFDEAEVELKKAIFIDIMCDRAISMFSKLPKEEQEWLLKLMEDQNEKE